MRRSKSSSILAKDFLSHWKRTSLLSESHQQSQPTTNLQVTWQHCIVWQNTELSISHWNIENHLRHPDDTNPRNTVAVGVQYRSSSGGLVPRQPCLHISASTVWFISQHEEFTAPFGDLNYQKRQRLALCSYSSPLVLLLPPPLGPDSCIPLLSSLVSDFGLSHTSFRGFLSGCLPLWIQTPCPSSWCIL